MPNKYNQYHDIKENHEEKNKIHPIWRGIGCILIVIIPLMSFFTADYMVKNHKLFSWMIIPEDIILKNFKDPYLFVKILYAIIFAFILFVIIGGITFLINKLFGPSKKGPFDL
jgi:hypothetical protein